MLFYCGHSLRTLVVLSCIIVYICPVDASIKPSNDVQKSVLQDAVRALLDFDKVPEPNDAIRPISKTANAASSYMRQLFQQYQDGKSSKDNTVRSINPSILASWDNADEVVFDLAAMKSQEDIMRVELHFNMRNKPSYKYKDRKRMRIRAVARVICDQFNTHGDELSIVGAGPRWLGFDARQVLLSALTMSSSCKSSPKLGVIFSHQRRRGVRAMSRATILRRHTPFLLVHSYDPSLVDEHRVSDSLFVGEATAPRAGKRVNEVDDYADSKYGRPKREVDSYYSYSRYDNKEDDKVKNYVTKFQNGGPGGVLDSRKKLRRRRKQRRKMKHRKSNFANPKSFGDFGKVDEDEYTEKSNRVNEIEHTDNGDTNPQIVLLDGKSETSGPCARHSLSVAFRDIGWENWIIAPKSFEAHYCAGQCTFPLKSDVRPSNHAYVQSIIHAIGIAPGVPQVCCAPDKMDSVSVLYFDQNDNVVLKNYPRMSVTSCGCL